MINSRLVQQQDALLHFEVMAYLIRRFGAPPRPPVPSPLHKTPGLESLVWNARDSRSVLDWAEDHFGEIKSLCHMEKDNAELLPAGEGLEAEETLANYRLMALAAGGTPYRRTGIEAIVYDPRDCTEPGHFAATTILQLAELRLEGYKPEPASSTLSRRLVTLTAAAYNRQGFVLANLPRRVSDYLTAPQDTRAVPHRIVFNTLCFSTCLALRVRRQSAEQIIGTYGTRMSRSFRRKIRQACRQIDSESEALATLQLLAEPKVRRATCPENLNRRA